MNLLEAMLQYDPEKRIKSKDCLTHIYFYDANLALKQVDVSGSSQTRSPGGREFVG